MNTIELMSSICGPRVRKLFLACAVIAIVQMLLLSTTNFRTFFQGQTERVHEVGQRDEKATCVVVKQELWPSNKYKLFRDYYHDIPKTKCAEEENWVKIDHGVFRITQSAKAKYRNITCDLAPLIRGKDDFDYRKGLSVRIKDGADVQHIGSEVNCSSGGARYANYHLTVPPAERLLQRAEEFKLPEGALGMNVLMFGFDSVSRMAWQRKLPKSYAYMMKVLKCTVLENFNIVGDGTIAALLPMLTGKEENELPDVRRGHTNNTLDDFPWIWNEYKKAGYVTQFTEDGRTWQWRMNGLKNHPTDYTNLHFYRIMNDHYAEFKKFCLGSEYRHSVMFNWVSEFLRMFKHGRTFSFGIHAELSHDGIKYLNIADEEFKGWLKYLYSNGYLNNTVLILMADHGARFSQKLRETNEGKTEERNPFFSFRLPHWFKQRYPRAFKNLLVNSKRLITPFDIHETFRHILNFRNVPVGNISNRGISIFSEIPVSRTCATASIKPHYCNCLNWKTIATNSSAVKAAGKAFIDFVNALMESKKDQCHMLEIDEIIRSVAYSRGKEYLEKTHAEVMLYQLTIHTKPGGGHFEATITHSLKNNTFTVLEREISRTNMYGDAPSCIYYVFPRIAAYCVCKKPGRIRDLKDHKVSK
ncbi:uncharacterized protein LOC135486430 [Lineus longissimus]|uniref:uncharacterized protein LOC135486430 n=1 Tax=Lineus longissimus TaxID=88925 RepID=UPI00315CAE7E